MNHRRRLAALQQRLDGPLLVSNLTNVRYLTGFTGSNAFLAVWQDRAVFVTDGRYGEAAAELVDELPFTDLEVYGTGLHATLAKVVDGAARLQVEEDAVSWGFARALGGEVKGELVPTSGIVAALRKVKDEDEIDALRRAASAGDAAFAALPTLIEGGGREADLGWALVEEMRRHGGDPAGWDPIVAAGPNASVPHYRSGHDPVGDGLLLLDYGCVVDGYHSDMTRTVWLGGAADAEMARVWDVVAEAQQAGIDAVTVGATGGDVDRVTRDVLARYGMAERMLHSTGHGVGLEIHEDPSLKTDGDEVLEPGHVVTVEPGVYLPGTGGVRIEDMVLVTESGPVVLTNSPKEPLTA